MRAFSFSTMAAPDTGSGHDHEPVVVMGTNFADLITTGGGPQEIVAGNGHDTVFAGGGPDILFGGNGNDELYGQGGPDQIFGGNGQDLLFGGGGPDVLDGGNGADVLIGGPAADVLTGGNGPDTFVFLSASDAPAHGGGDHDDEGHEDGGGEDGGHDDGGGHDSGPPFETITDFQPGVDVIDLAAIGTVTDFSDGPAAFSAWVEQDGANTILHVDTDGTVTGGSPGEMMVVLLDTLADMLGADDFIF